MHTCPNFQLLQIFFNMETESKLGKELGRNLSLAGASVLVVTLLVLRDIRLSASVLVTLSMTLVQVVGFVYFWGLTLDVSVCMSLVINVGLAIDYSLHIAQAHKQKSGG